MQKVILTMLLVIIVLVAFVLLPWPREQQQWVTLKVADPSTEFLNLEFLSPAEPPPLADYDVVVYGDDNRLVARLKGNGAVTLGKGYSYKTALQETVRTMMVQLARQQESCRQQLFPKQTERTAPGVSLEQTTAAQ